jgi:excisionase family DNA binding protein
MPEQLLSQAEAASRLGLSARSIQRYISKGAVNPTRLGRRVFLSERELQPIQEEGLPLLPVSETAKPAQQNSLL